MKIRNAAPDAFDYTTFILNKIITSFPSDDAKLILLFIPRIFVSDKLSKNTLSLVF